jgi:hypothetical protein
VKLAFLEPTPFDAIAPGHGDRCSERLAVQRGALARDAARDGFFTREAGAEMNAGPVAAVKRRGERWVSRFALPSTGSRFRMAFADVNGQHIRFDDSGGDGSAVILSHGFLMDREMFAPQVDALAAEFRVITWDGRGFGETRSDGQPFTYWDSARDCLGLLDHLRIERAVLGGMSQGGFLSLRAALLAPERVAALVLIGTQANLTHPDRVNGRLLDFLPAL